MSNFPEPPPPPNWATNIPARGSQSFKFHKTIGHAKSAITSYHDMVTGFRSGYAEAWILNWNGTTWETVYYVAPGTTVDDLPWKDPNDPRRSS
jgi:hypothetical protein